MSYLEKCVKYHRRRPHPSTLAPPMVGDVADDMLLHMMPISTQGPLSCMDIGSSSTTEKHMESLLLMVCCSTMKAHVEVCVRRGDNVCVCV